VQCSAVQCSAVQCSAVQCTAVQCSAGQCSAVHRARLQGRCIETTNRAGEAEGINNCAVCSVQCAVCSVQCAVCSVKCAAGAKLHLHRFEAGILPFLSSTFMLPAFESGD
jgi:hypothetical protein